ncbi:hypothetical protein Dfri01_52080 [Dyadobacter frigoris]|nr:hypothetical protein Dfri01_52080 [Dyadobacter frigoris]
MNVILDESNREISKEREKQLRCDRIKTRLNENLRFLGLEIDVIKDRPNTPA